MHKSGFFHRDLKPENFMFMEKNVIKNIIQSSIDLNLKMRSIFLEKTQRLHYVFTLRVLTSLFR